MTSGFETEIAGSASSSRPDPRLAGPPQNSSTIIHRPSYPTAHEPSP